MKTFKIHASQAWKITGRIGLTEKQEEELISLRDKKTPRTELQEKKYRELCYDKANPTLPDTWTTHLKEWYAEVNEQIRAKEIDKGNMCEQEVIEMLSAVLNEPMAQKNIDPPVEDDWMIGSCDIKLFSRIWDTKAPWNKKTLDNKATGGLEYEYNCQVKVYIHLYKKEDGGVFYGLVDTPEEITGTEYTFSHLPIEQRWVAFMVNKDEEFIKELIRRVEISRVWLAEYDKQVRSILGKIN